MHKKRVNLLSTTFFNSIFKVGSHHIYENILELGYSCRFISSPNSVFNLLRNNDQNQRLRNKFTILSMLGQIEKHNDEYIGLNLAPYVKLRRVTSKRFSQFLAINFSKPSVFEDADLSIIDAAEYLYLIPQLLKLKQTVVYRPTDIYPSANCYYQEVEERFVKNNQIKVWCMSKVSFDYYKHKEFNVVGFTPNGVPKNWVKNYKGYNQLKKIKIVYVGSFDDRVDYAVLSSLASKQFIELSLYGAGPGVGNLKNWGLHKNYHGAVNYDELEVLLRSFNVGLLPFNDNTKNLSRSPMKYYEYLACGLHVLYPNDLRNVLSLYSQKDLSKYLEENRICENQVRDKLSSVSWYNITKTILQNTLE